jgi:predicted RNase H-like HicB family nuclease
MTTRYIALIDGEAGAYGVAFPDAPGCAAMGKTMDEALRNAVVALAEWMADAGEDRPRARSIEELRRDPEVIEQIEEGAAFAVVPLLLDACRQVRANLSIDAGLLAAIDAAAEAAGLTRSAFLSRAARDKILADV